MKTAPVFVIDFTELNKAESRTSYESKCLFTGLLFFPQILYTTLTVFIFFQNESMHYKLTVTFILKLLDKVLFLIMSDVSKVFFSKRKRNDNLGELKIMS